MASDTTSGGRSIILFGRNVASYKFALAKSLTELGGHENAFIQPEDTSGFLSAFCEHVERNPK